MLLRVKIINILLGKFTMNDRIYYIIKYNYETSNYEIIKKDRNLANILYWFFENFNKFLTAIKIDHIEYFIDYD